MHWETFTILIPADIRYNEIEFSSKNFGRRGRNESDQLTYICKMGCICFSMERIFVLVGGNISGDCSLICLSETRSAVTKSVVQHQTLNTMYLSCFGQVFVQIGKHISWNCRNMFVQDEKCSYKEALRLSKPQMPHQHHICTQPAQFRLI